MMQSFRNAPNIISNLKSKFGLPAKFRGTIVEKWANYWKNLFIDYRQMLQDLRGDIQDNPRKALIWSTGLATVYAFARNNPNELDFKDCLKRITNEMVMVTDDCRNPKSTEHVQYLDRSYNEGVIHYRSLGIASFMYTSELGDSCDLYKAHCKHLQPSYISFPSRIIDVGFMGRWWNIYMKTVNYDVNVNNHSSELIRN